ncbi:MAG: diguanylate cyclase [Candidatus Omnitrophica bacterium]|nr:diguanylate cyclase [Candidatus Omnitrophota bacterium]
MTGTRGGLSLMPRGIRHKVVAAYCLMSIIPLLVIGWLISRYVFSGVKSPVEMINLTAVVLITILISLLGVVLTKRIVDPVVRLAYHARSIASGDVERVIEVQGEDEVGDMGLAVNEMADRIKKNMSELNTYGERVRVINQEINKKVAALSGVLQVTTLMSQAVQLDVVLELVLDKLQQATEANAYVLFIQGGEDLSVRLSRGIAQGAAPPVDWSPYRELLMRMERTRDLVIFDGEQRKNILAEDFFKKYGMGAGVLAPVVFQNKLKGLIFVGSKDPDLVFPPADLEVVRIFQKQVGIALENDFLVKRNKELAIRDEVTGLYNERFIRERLSEEIRRAILFQRPCSYVHLNIDHYDEYVRVNSPVAAQELLKKIGQVISKNIDDICKAGRSGKNDFAIILPEKNKGEALQTAELIRKEVARQSFPGMGSLPDGRVTLSAGVSANPIDGLTGDELVNKAIVALLQAKKSGRNQVTA